MGLDIRAYNKLQAEDTTLDSNSEEFYEAGFLHLYANPAFPGRAEGIDPNKAYKGDRVFSFRAGSYSGYNAWRDELAELAGYGETSFEGGLRKSAAASAWAAESGPFWELINFSDCEGTIGPVVSAKLAKDFQDFQEKANSFSDEYFQDLYGAWRRAFELAADNGVVIFS